MLIHAHVYLNVDIRGEQCDLSSVLVSNDVIFQHIRVPY